MRTSLKKRLLTLTLCLFLSLVTQAQQAQQVQPPLVFAYIADTHIGSSESASQDLIATIADINAQEQIAFVILAGDVTEFGSDREIATAKELLNALHKPYYILSGNHDSNWSESGCNTFVKIFGYEFFTFDANGFRFMGCNSGPNMRMAPALVPREAILWLDSLVSATLPEQPIIFINHYPLDDAMLNYGEVLDILKRKNIQLALCGHGHNNMALDFEGVPAVMGRSNLRNRDGNAGYTLITINGSRIDFQERLASGQSLPIWFTLRMSNGPAFRDNTPYPRPDYSVNRRYPNVLPLWEVQDNSDIGAGAMVIANKVLYGNTQGEVKALDLLSGKPLWSVKTKGKIFSTPAVMGRRMVIASTDGCLYCLDVNSGATLWSYPSSRAIVASPTILGNHVYIGGSDGSFTALSLSNGKVLWNYDGIEGFISAKPYTDREGVYIGSWGSHLYAFHPISGKLQWSWTNNKGRGLSPAAVWPVKANGKIFAVTPERITYAIDAKTGKTIWSARGGRESIGLSGDKKQMYIKTMQDTVIAFSTLSDTAQVVWRSHAGYGYEISPSPITVQDGLLFVPTDKGVIYALKESDGSVAWVHKLSNALINYINPIGDRKLLVTTMDGKVALLSY